ncbi:uncharacterized protein LOC129592656 [Paramacrobiotus metropolitanus]|uniref:uncharacterized protein LOC129592656 n=1 Tax=Paramacrobiotus metropolitanus TaxID=2943436 RepID=UPI002445D432|nr:uncharacterized protein LOC129592656 [Paramacrobiotus metropolitanus]
MTAVAVADLVLLWFALPLYLWNTASSFQLPYRTVYYNTTRATTYAVLPYMAWGQEWSLEFCDWVLIVFSIERLLAVIRPFGFKWLQRPLTARIIIIILFVLAAMFAVCNFPYWLEINRVKDGKRTRKYWPKYLKEWYPIQEMAELIMCLSKFFGLLLINLILIAAIKRQQNSEIGKMRAAQRANSDKKYRNSNVLLLSSVALYLISWFPSVVYKCMEISDIYHMYNFDYTAKMVATAPCQIMSFLYYSVNFFLYLTVSKKYRMEFARIFAPIFCPSWAKKHWKSMSDSINTTVRPNRSKAAGVPSSATSVAKNGKPGGGTGGKQEVGKTVSTATVISLHDSGKEKTALTPVSTIKESVT